MSEFVSPLNGTIACDRRINGGFDHLFIGSFRIFLPLSISRILLPPLLSMTSKQILFLHIPTIHFGAFNGMRHRWQFKIWNEVSYSTNHETVFVTTALIWNDSFQSPQKVSAWNNYIVRNGKLLAFLFLHSFNEFMKKFFMVFIWRFCWNCFLLVRFRSQ